MKKIVYILVLITFVLCMDKINAYTEYKIGDVVSYNGMDFYVIKNSDSKDDTVTLLKAEPLTVEEVNRYGGVGTANNHVNMYNCSKSGENCYHTAYDNNGYGAMAYYTSIDCGYGDDSNYTSLGCKSSYEQSEVKYVVDAWKAAKVPLATEARLIQYSELENLGYVEGDVAPSGIGFIPSQNTPNWVYNNNYYYWTMTPANEFHAYIVNYDIKWCTTYVNNNYGVIRPVITLSKTVFEDTTESIVDSDTEQQNKNDISNDSKETKTSVKVANTYMSSSIIIIILGSITASVSVLITYKLSNKKKNK